MLSYHQTATGIEIEYNLDQLLQAGREENWIYDEPPGYPSLKTISFLVGVPQEGKIEWHYESGPSSYVDGVEIGPVEIMDFSGRRKLEVEKENRYYPEPVSVEGPYRFRDLRVVRVKLAPQRYNPVKKRLAIAHSLRLIIRFEKRGISRPQRGERFEPILKEIILNYPECRNWRFDPLPLNSSPQLWYRIKIPTNAIYKIDYEDFQKAGINPNVIDPRTVKIYTSSFHTLPRSLPVEFADTLVEVPIYFKGEDDGHFDEDDYLIFYGRSANWYTVTDESLHFNLNPYTDTNCYWIDWGGVRGKRMVLVDGRPKHRGKNHAPSLRHLEENKYNLARSGLRWLWREILFADSFYIYHPGADGDAELTITHWYGPSTVLPIQIYINNQIVFDDSIVVGPSLKKLTIPVVLQGDSSKLKIVRPGEAKYPLYIDYIDLVYLRHLSLDQPLEILIDPGPYDFRVEEVDHYPFLLDITDPLQPEMIYNVEIKKGKIEFSLNFDRRSHLILTEEPLKAKIEFSPRGQLRREAEGAEFLIITPKLFKNTLLPLLHYRRKNLRVRLITLEEVFNDFAAGRFDPTAIRNFLYYTTLTWKYIPCYILFVGDGSYDYKNYLGRSNPPNYFPVYEADLSYTSPDANKCYDDWFVTFDGGIAMIVGRLPVQGKGQLRYIIKKIFEYESGRYQGDWQNRILLLADDEYGANERWEWGGTWAHAANCESALKYIPEAVEPRKVYSMIYPKESGNTRPEATNEFIENLNEGCFLSLYYGHGNHHQISHEKIFMYEDIGRIANGKKYFIIYFGSCGVSRFDDTKWESIGEDLLRVSGAIATIGATRGTSTSPNLDFGNRIAKYLWMGYGIGDAVYLAKISTSQWNSRLYQLFTDPATKSIASRPTLTLTIDPDTLLPTKTGTIIALPGYEALVYLRDSITGWYHHILRPPNAPESTFTFQLLGSPIHRGRASRESLTFALPRFDPRYDPVVRVQIFKDGNVGMKDSIPVYDSLPYSLDHDGPEIKLYYGGVELFDSAEIESPATITGRVEDPSGINIALDDEYSMGENSFAVLLNGKKLVDLRREFVFDLDSYTKGSFHFILDLPKQKESNTLTISAIDNLYNLTEKTYTIFEAPSDQLKIEDFLVYPNPVRRLNVPVSFTFTLNCFGYGELRIYSVSGRRVAVLKNLPLKRGFNVIRWQPDQDLGNGVYLVRLLVEGTEGRKNVAVERFIIAQ